MGMQRMYFMNLLPQSEPENHFTDQWTPEDVSQIYLQLYVPVQNYASFLKIKNAVDAIYTSY